MNLRWMLAAGALLVGCGDGGGSADGTSAPAPAPEQVPGQLTYQRFCFSCHASGAAGAPRLGDVAAWAPRIEKGEDVLIQSVIDGVPPGMPARGLCVQCSDEELAATVRFMIERSQ